MTESIYKFTDITDALDIDVSKLGCIMLDTEGIPVREIMSKWVGSPEDDLYFSDDPKLRYVQGAVGEETSHLTLLYGLLQPGPEWSEHVTELLEDIDLSRIDIEDVEVFPNVEYSCIVARVKLTPELKLAHARLQYLPHVNTFPEYKAHITLAYVKNGEAEDMHGPYDIVMAWQAELSEALTGKSVTALGLNLGGNDA